MGTGGITVNAILPTVIAGAGLSSDGVRPQVLDLIRSFNPMQRAGTVGDVADVAEFPAGELSGNVSGQHLKISGGAPA